MKTSHFKAAVVCWCVLIGVPVSALGEGTCADPNESEYSLLLMEETESTAAKITFSEFNVGTYITNQYANLGIIFGGDNPKIMNDNPLYVPTTPVLGTPDPEFQGDIEGYFVSPHDGTTPMMVSWFSFTAGWFEQIGATRLEWFDMDDNKLGDANNLGTGVYHFDIEGEGIARWRIGIIGTEPAGYAIDNVDFDNPYLIKLTKTDDINDDPNQGPTCVVPEDEITYTICYENTTDQTFYNTYIIDYLPAGVDYDYVISASPPVVDANYNSAEHYYKWQIGTIEPNETGCVEITVTVNEKSDPLFPLHNVAELWDDDIRLGDAEEYTAVCIWDMGSIILVDASAPPGGNGTSWPLAYNDIQDAIDRINLTNDPNIPFEIWVADGTYTPGGSADDSFEIPDDVLVYGGYAGYGAADPNERDWKKYKTILSGYLDETHRNNVVVTMGDNSLLDGFIVEEGVRGIDGSNVSSTVKNCVIRNNVDYGIYYLNGDLTVQWCEIYNDGFQGIYHEGYGYSLAVEHCKIHDNQYDGIRTDYSTSTILNSLIYQNGYATSYSYGLFISNPSSSPIIRNNTIVYNANEGIRALGSLPQVKNCILYYNNDEGNQLYGLTWQQITYCCIPDCNEVSGNINDAPDFVYDHGLYGYYHIKYESPCRNAGSNTGVGQSETDMDDETRIAESTIDIGADEVECEDTWNENDWTTNGVINLEEYAIFSAAWLSHDPNEPGLSDPNLAENWNPVCNLDATENTDTEFQIDLADFILFCENWLWEACWHSNYMEMYGMMSGGGIVAEASSFGISTVISAQAEIQQVPEKSIEEKILDLQSIVEFLEKIWLQEPDIQQKIDPDDWQKFMDSLNEYLTNLQSEVL